MALALLSGPAVATAQTPPATTPVRIGLIYTGRSLGALGVLQDTDEHELLIEQAEKQKLQVRLGTRLGWRAGSLSLFSPDRDLDAADLAAFLAGSVAFTEGPARGLVSNNAILLELADGTHDLLGMLRANPRAPIDFPDLREAQLTVQRGRLADGRRLIVVTEAPDLVAADAAAWSPAPINRIDIDDAALYEISVNLGPMGSRATALGTMRLRAETRGITTVVADLGARDGDLGLERSDRARLDYGVLTTLGYQIIVPYEFELALTAPGLQATGKEFPNLLFLASNVKAPKAEGLLRSRHILEIGGVKIGLIGLVDPDLQGVLAKSSLTTFTFESPIDAATREVAELRKAGAGAVVALSNLHPRDNNLLAREVMGLDAIVADLHVRWSPEDIDTEVQMPDRPRSRPGSPALVARSFANGLGLGELVMEFRTSTTGGRYLAALSHHLESITDRVPADAALVKDLRARAARAERPRGAVLIPPFAELVTARPALGTYDAAAAEGRISKRMWEEFLARLVRGGARAEVGIIRKLPNFPPAIGELREAEVRSWLWTEDAIVTLDLSGADIRQLLKDDARGDLVMVGIDRTRGFINGRRIQDLMLYRIATSDLLLDGGRFVPFERARRIVRRFRIAKDGTLDAGGRNELLQIRTYALAELARMRTMSNGAARLARMLDRDPAYEPLFTFSFDRPTVFASFNRTEHTDGYGAVPESRVVAPDSQVIGISGHYELAYEGDNFGLDTGLLAAYARNRIGRAGIRPVVTSETADDILADTTFRARRSGIGRVQPFVRAAFDTEFTPSIDPSSGRENRKQQLARASAGLLRRGQRWIRAELGGTLETDIARGSREYGFEGAVIYQRRLPGSGLLFRWDSAFSHYFPAPTDDVTDLGTKVRNVTELQIPLLGELSFSIAVDIFAFKGKVERTKKPGASAILRVGISYDRLWKPRFQPFF